jgi:hypothetical protein
VCGHAAPSGRGVPGDVEARAMAEEGNQQALLTALTTEHFTLQGARAQTIGESGSRSALYLGSVSSALIGLGFVTQATGPDSEVFQIFALTVLPTVFFLGLFTFVRLVESSVEDILYGRAINRIRNYYLEIAGADARYFMMSGYDDALGVISNMGIEPGSRWQLLFTAASAVSVVNGVVGGSALAILIGVTLDLPLAVAALAGAASFLFSLGVMLRYDRRRHEEVARGREPLFPSPVP